MVGSVSSKRSDGSSGEPVNGVPLFEALFEGSSLLTNGDWLWRRLMFLANLTCQPVPAPPFFLGGPAADGH